MLEGKLASAQDDQAGAWQRVSVLGLDRAEPPEILLQKIR